MSPRFTEALVLAASLHRSQVRKGPKPIPYIGHLLSVAGIVIDFGGTEDEAIAALLHDAVEDQGGPPTRDTIRRLFGEEVVRTVDACSDTDEEPKPSWRLRKTRYIAHLRTATPSAALVSAADKLANARAILTDLREIGDEIWTRFNCTKQESLWYYRAVVDALRETLINPSLLSELDLVVAEIEQLARGPLVTTRKN
jgi:GTP pyrophosphokinase